MLFYDSIGLLVPKLADDVTGPALNSLDKSSRLVISTRATFSGYLLNGRVYPGIHMKDATATWCDAKHGGRSTYNRPFLVNHNLDSDPVGRVVSASYHQLKSGRDFLEDFKRPDTQFPGGSGYIQLTAHITNPDAIEKCLRGEYLTVSTAYDSSIAVCSVCGTNVAEEKWCGHVPGKSYEVEDEDSKVLCYFVPGPMSYREISFVNQPAQPQAVVSTMTLEDAQQVFPSGGTNLQIPVDLSIFRDSDASAVPLTGGSVKVKRRRSISTAIGIDAPAPKSEDSVVDVLVRMKALSSDALMVNRTPFVGISPENGMDHVHVFYGWVETDGAVHGFSSYEGPLPTGNTKPTYHSHLIEDEVSDFNAEAITVESTSVDDHKHSMALVLHPVNKETEDSVIHLDSLKPMVESAERRIREIGSADARDANLEARLIDLGSDVHNLDNALKVLGYAKLDDAVFIRVMRGITERAVTLGYDKILRQAAEEDMTKPNESNPPATPAPDKGGSDVDRLRTLTDELTAKAGELKSVTTDRDNKSKELEAANKRIAELETQLHTANCDKLALTRALNRDETFDSPESLRAHSTELQKRATNSVLDSLADADRKLARSLKLLPGLGRLIENKEDSEPAAETEQEHDGKFGKLNTPLRASDAI